MRRRQTLALIALGLLSVVGAGAVGLHRRLQPTAQVTLRTVGTDGRPLSGVQLAFADYDVKGQTDENGVAQLTVPYEIPHYAELEEPPGYAFLGDAMIVSVCEPQVSLTIVLRPR
jgi:hypothetical protein